MGVNRARSTGRIKAALVALALAGAPGSATTDAHGLKGRVLGAEGTGGVWLGVVADGNETATWTLVEGVEFDVAAPLREEVALVALAKDRVPAVVPLRSGWQGRHVEVVLRHGLSIEGAVRDAEGKGLAGVDLRAVPVKAAPDVLAPLIKRPNIGIPLDETNTELELPDGRRVAIPPFAWPEWQTDRQGAFRVGGLETGRYLLEASTEGYVSALLKDVAVGGDVGDGIEVVLHGEFFVSGHVVDGTGAPVADAEVLGEWAQPEAEAAGDGSEPARDAYSDRGTSLQRLTWRRAAARTSVDGSFRLGPFEAGPKVEVVASAVASGSSRRREVAAPYDGLVLALGRDVALGHVVDADTGEPIDRFQLIAYGRFGSHSTSHVDGRFEAQLDPDADSVVVEAPGYFPWFSRLASLAGGVDLGEIALERPRSITGRVRYVGSGEPIADATVCRASLHLEGSLGVFTNNRFRCAETQADGTFVLGNLPKSADRLRVGVGDRGTRYADLPRAVAHLEIELDFDSAISGFLALPNGTPARGIVGLQRIGGYYWEGDVAEDGAFRWDHLQGGQYLLTAESDMGTVEDLAVTVATGESARGIRLTVEPGGRLSGRITGLLRGEQATVTLWDRSGRAVVLRREFGNGAYSLRGVPETTIVTARTNERWHPPGALVSGVPVADRSLTQGVRLDELGEAHLDMDFSGGSQLTGTVRIGGRPAEGIDLEVVPEDGSRPTAYATTGERGRYRARGIADGLHTVRTRGGHSFQVHVAERAELDIDLPDVSVSGAVRHGRGGEPVRGGRARLARADAPRNSRRVAAETRIDGDGRFRFEGLARGDYIVHVSHRDFAENSLRVRVAGAETVELHLAPTDQ